MVLLKWNNVNQIAHRLNASTFHYGSIKMIGGKRGVWKLNISTFHNGSIKIA